MKVSKKNWNLWRLIKNNGPVTSEELHFFDLSVFRKQKPIVSYYRMSYAIQMEIKYVFEKTNNAVRMK